MFEVDNWKHRQWRHAEAVEGGNTAQDEDLEDSKLSDSGESIDVEDDNNCTADTSDSEESREANKSRTTAYSFFADGNWEVRNMQGLGFVCGVHDMASLFIKLT